MPDDANAELAERIRRLEAQLAESRAPVPAPNEEQLATRVLAVLAERASQRGIAVVPPIPGLNTGALIPARNYGPDAPPGVAPPMPDEAGIRSWLLAQVASEFRLMFKMYFDPRYRQSRVAQFGVPIILGLFACTYLLFNLLLIQIPIFTPLAERLVDVVLAVALYKVLAREAVRYRHVLEYLSNYGYA